MNAIVFAAIIGGLAGLFFEMWHYLHEKKEKEKEKQAAKTETKA